MKLLFVLALSLAGATSAFADLSQSQEQLRNSPGKDSRGGAHETSPNDLSNSQEHLRRSGGRGRPVYMSCQEANFGTQFWWECRQISPR